MGAQNFDSSHGLIPTCYQLLDTFRSQNCRKFSSVNLKWNVLEDDSGPDSPDHLLEAGASLHLSRVEDIGQLQDVLAGDHDFRSER